MTATDDAPALELEMGRFAYETRRALDAEAILPEMLDPGRKQRDTADCDTPARCATS